MNALTQKEFIVELPEGFTARAAQMNDIEACLALFNRWSRSVIGRDEIIELEAIRNDLDLPDFSMENDIRLVFAPNGDMAGYLEAWTLSKPPVHPWIWARVDPDYEDKGIGTWLLKWAEEHVLQALERVPADLRFAVAAPNPAASGRRHLPDLPISLLRPEVRGHLHEAGGDLSGRAAGYSRYLL